MPEDPSSSSRRTRIRSRTRAAQTPQEPQEPQLPLLSHPRQGLPPVIDRVQTLLAWCERAASAPHEPVALDAERASSYRYSQKAYLVQLRTEAAGTALWDPTAFAVPGTLARTLAGREWVLHAAAQDLPNLIELGLVPDRLFDTELAGRLLGMPKVSLGAMVEDTLGMRLAKEHSAADWSRRPLPESWLVYAALDVEVLVEVRDILAGRLEAVGKLAWALEEFEHLKGQGRLEQVAEPWRGLTGIGALRSGRQLAVARALWQRRDELARAQDLSPHRVLRDRQIVDAARLSSRGKSAVLAALPAKLRDRNAWWQAARSGLELGDAHLPERNARQYPPPHKLWQKKHPEVWARYVPIRDAVASRAEQVGMPTENLIKPGLLRQWVWEHPAPGEESVVRVQLEAIGARPWQAEVVAPVIAAASR